MVCSRGLENRNLLDRGALGSGPYRLVESVSGDHYTFQVRNGYRWGPNGATTAAQRLPARVILRVVSNESDRGEPPADEGAQRRHDPRRRARPAQRPRTTSGGRRSPSRPSSSSTSGRASPARTRRVRRAIVQAINLQAVRHGRHLGPRRARHAAHEAGRHAVPRQHRGRHRARVQPRRRPLGAQRQGDAAPDHLPDRRGHRDDQLGDGAHAAAALGRRASASRWPG